MEKKSFCDLKVCASCIKGLMSTDKKCRMLRIGKLYRIEAQILISYKRAPTSHLNFTFWYNTHEGTALSVNLRFE